MSANFSPQNPITRDTFSDAWNYAVKKNVQAQKGHAARGAITFCSHLLFFLGFVTLLYGAIYETAQPFVKNIMNQIPQLVNLWTGFSAVLYGTGASTAGIIIRSVLFLLGVPLVVCLVVYLLVSLFYHPKAAELPKGEGDQPKALRAVAHQIQQNQKKKYGNSYGLGAIFFALLVVIFVLLYFFFFKHNVNVVDPLHATGTKAPIYVVLLGFGVVVCYVVGNLVMSLILRPLYTTKVPDAFFQNVEDYYDRSGRQPKAPVPEHMEPLDGAPQ